MSQKIEGGLPAAGLAATTAVGARSATAGTGPAKPVDAVAAGDSLRLTGDGEILVEHGKKMLALNEEAFASIRPDQVVGAVRLGAVTHYAIHILPPLLAEFSARYPAVRIELLAGDGRVLDSVQIEVRGAGVR